jgi:hypothetical protein
MNTYFPEIKDEQELARKNLSEAARKLPSRNRLCVINGKIIFRGRDLLRALGVDVIA